MSFRYKVSRFSEADEPRLRDLHKRVMAGEWLSVTDMAEKELQTQYGFPTAKLAGRSFRVWCQAVGLEDLPRARGQFTWLRSKIPAKDHTRIRELYDNGMPCSEIARLFNYWGWETTEAATEQAIVRVLRFYGHDVRAKPYKWTEDALTYAGAKWWRAHGEMPTPGDFRNDRSLPAHWTILRRFETFERYYDAVARRVRDLGWCEFRPPPPAPRVPQPYVPLRDLRNLYVLYESGMSSYEVAELVFDRYDYGTPAYLARALRIYWKRDGKELRSTSEARKLTISRGRSNGSGFYAGA